jgi:hypothetical protein
MANTYGLSIKNERKDIVLFLHYTWAFRWGYPHLYWFNKPNGQDISQMVLQSIKKKVA